MNEQGMNAALEPDDQVDLTGDAYQRWAARVPPDLTQHPSAVMTTDDGLRVLLADRGDVLIFNVHASCLPGRPYLRTVKGRVLTVDAVNCTVWVFDMDRHNKAVVDYGRPRPLGDEVRFPAGSLKERYDAVLAQAAAAIEQGDLSEAIRLRDESSRIMGRVRVTEDETTGKRKVGRPRKVRSAEELALEKERAERRARGEVRRGRPKGSKNRPKDVIAAERAIERDRRRRVAQ